MLLFSLQSTRLLGVCISDIFNLYTVIEVTCQCHIALASLYFLIKRNLGSNLLLVVSCTRVWIMIEVAFLPGVLPLALALRNFANIIVISVCAFSGTEGV